MKASIEIGDNIHWSKLNLSDEQVERALAKGAEVILAYSNTLVPKAPKEARNGQMLVGTGSVKTNRGGAKTVAITYDSPYAHWIHEHLWFKHPHGGQAKFLETAMRVKGKNAFKVAAGELLR